MQVGVAGLGKMGTAIAERLIETGNAVTVWNRSADKCRPLAAAGAHVATSAAALAGAVEAVITILTDGAALDAVYGGPAGLLVGDVTGKLFIEMSTVPGDVDIALAARVRAKGATLVECPVGGTTGPARQGKLIGLMGAEPADAVRAKPLLDQLCRRLEHCGPVGAGAVMKLAVNLPLIVYWQAFGEALALCAPLGIDPPRLIDLMSDTAGAAAVLKLRAPAVVKMLAGEDAGPVTFAISDCTKDLRTMVAEAKRRGLPLPVTEQTLACFEEAARHGLGTADAARQPVYWSGRPQHPSP
jgi:3-hydroxyisobutyrate dehydrogenase